MQKMYTYSALSEQLGVSAPLLMLDRLTLDCSQRTASGCKMVSMNEFIFAGHFPAHAVMPGMLQVAAMAQACRMLMLECFPGAGIPAMSGLRRVKFRKPVSPGMVLHLEAAVLSENPDGSVDFEVKNTVNGDLASAGTITMHRVPVEALQQPAPTGKTGPVQPLLTGTVSDAQELMRHIPHRLPIFLIDCAYNLGVSTQVAGYKNITGNDIMCQGNIYNMFPAYLQLEAAAQLGCAHILCQPDYAGKLGFFMSVDEAHFYRFVFPGEQLQIKVDCNFGGRYGVASGQVYVEDVLAAEATLKFAIIAAGA